MPSCRISPRRTWSQFDTAIVVDIEVSGRTADERTMNQVCQANVGVGMQLQALAARLEPRSMARIAPPQAMPRDQRLPREEGIANKVDDKPLLAQLVHSSQSFSMLYLKLAITFGLSFCARSWIVSLT